MPTIQYKIDVSECSNCELFLTQYIRDVVVQIPEAKIFCMNCPDEIIFILDQSSSLPLEEAYGLTERVYSVVDEVYKKFKNNILIFSLAAPRTAAEFYAVMDDIDTVSNLVIESEIPDITF